MFVKGAKEWELRFRVYLERMLRDFAHEGAWYAEQADRLVDKIEVCAKQLDGDEALQHLEWLAFIITKCSNIVWPRKRIELIKVRGQAIRLLCGFPERENEFQKGVRGFRNCMAHFEEQLELRRYIEYVVVGRNLASEDALEVSDPNILIPAGRLSLNGTQKELYIDLRTSACHVLGKTFDLRECASEAHRISRRMDETLNEIEMGFYEWGDKFDRIISTINRSKLEIMV